VSPLASQALHMPKRLAYSKSAESKYTYLALYRSVGGQSC